MQVFVYVITNLGEKNSLLNPCGIIFPQGFQHFLIHWTFGFKEE
jgi:hypothetical protein